MNELEMDVIDDSSTFDVMMVAALRRLTTQFIMENRGMKLANNGTTSLEDVLLEAYPDYE